MHACTIITRDRLAMARALAVSFSRQHPEGTLHVLALDDVGRDVVSEPFEIVRPCEIGLDERELHRMAMIYNRLELSCALKPWLIRTIHTRTHQAVVYLDADTLVLAPIDDLATLAGSEQLVLTPHLLRPLPDDGKEIDERTLRHSGTFNGGCLAVAPEARPFLDWWAARLSRGCRLAADDGQFYDQRYLDAVPALFPHHVLRDPTVNVAYWNAHERPVSWSGAVYEVDGRPLRTFHFSGFDPARPWLLSRHQVERPRIVLTEHPGLARLCRDYADALHEQGFAAESAPYPYAILSNGTRVDGALRQRYREELIAAERGGAPEPPDPFDPGSTAALESWVATAVRQDEADGPSDGETEPEPAAPTPEIVDDGLVEPLSPSGLDRSIAYVERGPENGWDADSPHGAAGRLVRQGLERMLRPHRARQREFEEAVVDALKELNHRIHALENGTALTTAPDRSSDPGDAQPEGEQ